MRHEGVSRASARKSGQRPGLVSQTHRHHILLGYKFYVARCYKSDSVWELQVGFQGVALLPS